LGSEAAEGNEKWGVEVGIADKNWGQTPDVDCVLEKGWVS